MCFDTARVGASEECRCRWVAVQNRYATINGNLGSARHSVSREVGGVSKGETRVVECKLLTVGDCVCVLRSAN